jgi:hypothetical protein
VYRGLLAGRKVLVVLDDAAGESQISALLPGTQTAAVLITSRHGMGGLAGDMIAVVRSLQSFGAGWR